MNNITIVANWKMNPGGPAEAQNLFAAVAKGVQGIEGVEVVLCPPFVYLHALDVSRSQSSNDSFGGQARFALHVGAQDCFWEDNGAYTGEVSPTMLKGMGCSHVILGHSERKKYLGETEEMVRKKTVAALKAGLNVVLCVGDGQEVPKEAPGLIVAYEPEWAVSTEGGRAADSKLVAAKVAEMRRTLKSIPILYGGSVDSSNIAGFLGKTGVQGALVGSASLDAKEFIALVKNAAS